VVASAPASDRLLLRLAMWPKTGRGAVVFVTLWALGTAWLNWGFSLISSALLAKR
jgi:short-chain fatty acids transporter